jgi:type III pantothenate kinase
MILVIDIGNTKIKVAVLEQDTIIDKEIIDASELLICIKNKLNKYKKITCSIVSSVAKCPNEAIEVLKSSTDLLLISTETKFPFHNKYATPETLGLDRKVLVAGAVLKFPKQNCLIIDAGSCITYDFVDNKSNYFGGAISPGIAMRYNALNNFTAKLPLLEMEYPKELIGNSTEQSIHSGIINGFLYEMEGFIANYTKEHKDLTIILTGGDTDFLAKRLKSTIFANSNFLLESLNLLYQYNKK